MTQNPARPSATRRARGLIAVLVGVALAGLGCGATDRGTDGVPLLWPAGGHLGSGDPVGTHRPTVRRLDPDLLAALEEAARDAQQDGVPLVVTSGRRSRAHQQRLLDEAVARYGSEEEALRWVATPDTSAHVTGDAVDIGPTQGADWLSRHGSDYGLCQVFANESWHYELATTAGGDCPELLPDSSSRSQVPTVRLSVA